MALTAAVAARNPFGRESHSRSLRTNHFSSDRGAVPDIHSMRPESLSSRPVSVNARSMAGNSLSSQLDEFANIDWASLLPPSATFVRDEQVMKKGTTGAYLARRIVTTDTHIYFCQVGEEVILDDIALHEIESITQLHSIQEFMSKSSILQKDLALRPAASGAHTSPERPADAPGVTPSIPTPPSDSSRRGSLRVKNDTTGASVMLQVPDRPGGQQKCDLRPQDQQNGSRLRLVFRRMSQELSGSANYSPAPAPLPSAGAGQRQEMCEFCISTAADGGHSVRYYYIRAQNEAECAEWVAYLTKASQVAKRQYDSTNAFLRIKSRCASIYHHDLSQMLVALLIGLSFVTNVLEVQLNPAETDLELTRLFSDVDIVFTVLFVLELLLNLFVHWLRPFFQEWWNIFDFVVVSVSVISLFTSSIGSATAMRSIRLMRAFRVLRLFGRLQELRNIVEALGRSLVPVASAFTIVTLVLCVYAIVGVQLFHEEQQDSFGNFGKALYTMFAASTMDGWQELVAIPFISEDEAAASATVPTAHVGLILFFVSFFLIVAWTLLPVVIAVLLDNFSGAINDSRKAQDRDKLKSSGLDRTEHILDPLLEVLCQHESEDDLKQRVENLFYALIGEVDGDKLSAHSFIVNLARKRFRGNSCTIHLSYEDFHALTRHGLLCGRDGCLSVENFQDIMQLELKAYVERQVSKELLATSYHGPESVAALLLAVKDITARLAALESGINEIRMHGGMKSKVLPEGTMLRRSKSDSIPRSSSLQRTQPSKTRNQPPPAIPGLQDPSFDIEAAIEERLITASSRAASDRPVPQVRRTVRGASSGLESDEHTDGAQVTIDLGFKAPGDSMLRNTTQENDAEAPEPPAQGRLASSTSSPRPVSPSPSPVPMPANIDAGGKGGIDAAWDKLRTKQLRYQEIKLKAQASKAR